MPALTIPDDTYRRLAERATEQQTTVDELVARLLADATLRMTTPPVASVLDFLDSLPAVARTPDEWAEYDRAFLERRTEWGR